jgi:malonyl-CoA/methylmalonyl-CoA synthetase
LDYFLQDAEPEMVITEPVFADRLKDLARKRDVTFLETEDLCATSSDPLPEIVADRRAMILYTSGATGKPKGVVATHLNIAAQIRCLEQAWGWTSEDRALHILPLHHVHGIVNVLCCSLWAGAICRMLPKFEASRVYEEVVSGETTTFMAVPTIYVKLIAAWDNWGAQEQRRFSEACAQMRLMVSGSAALPVCVANKWKEISGHTLLERYGMTEIGMALSNPLHGERRLGTVGVVLPGVEVQLADSKGKRVLEEGLPGEILVRGQSVFKEYWRREETTRASFRDDWFQTGDIAVVDDGYYRILGRSSVDIIKTGGYKVSALEIEEVLRQHPKIQECAVVGIPDDEWGERVSSVVVLRPDCSLQLKDLRQWAADKLVKYKVPSRLLVLEELPRNALGKVRKPELKHLFTGVD